MQPSRLTRSLGLVLLLAGGCAHDAASVRPRSDAERAKLRELWGESGATGVEPRSVIVREGVPPLVWVCDQATTVMITDDKGGSWGPVAVNAGDAVMVDDRSGIRVGPQRLARGPLAANRIYQLQIGIPVGSDWSTHLQRIEPPKEIEKRERAHDAGNVLVP